MDSSSAAHTECRFTPSWQPGTDSNLQRAGKQPSAATTERHGLEWNAELCACGAALVGCHGCCELRCLTCDPYTDYERLNRCCTAPPSETMFDSDWLGKPALTEKHYSAASPSGLIGSLWLVLKGRRLHA